MGDLKLPVGWDVKRWWPSSVCQSVSLSCAWPKSRTEGHRKQKIGRKEAHDTGDPWPHLEVERSKVKVTRPLNAVTENQPYLRNGKAYTNSKLGTRMSGWSTRITYMRGDLQSALGGCSSSRHLHGAGTYCGGRSTDFDEEIGPVNHSSILPLMALNSLYCADVPLSNYSLTHSLTHSRPVLCLTVYVCVCVCVCARIADDAGTPLRIAGDYLPSLCWNFTAAAHSGSFTSPRYPRSYPNATECIQTLVGRSSRQLLLYLREMLMLILPIF